MNKKMNLNWSVDEITGNMPDISSMRSKEFQVKETSNTELLKDYLKRLGNGEDLESVKKDFVQNFSDVEASEIMKAEQELIKEGTPITEVQKLCDVHSALFHGLTKEEKIANAEKAVEESLKKEERSEMKIMPDAYVRKHELAKALRETKGHPLYSFTEENEKFSKEISDIRGALEKGEDVSKKISDFRQIAIHYAKKGDLIYPLLKVRYEISGPSDVMWTVDDEIRDELAAIDKESNHDEEWINRVQAVLTRADEMIYKENNILFPICAVNFTVEEWYGIYEDAKDYALVYGIENRWEEAEKYVQDKKNRHKAAINEGEIVMGGGHMSVAQLEAMLNTLPIEITFIDDNNINRFFNEGAKVFKRPGMAIDREVFSCHPPKIEPMVRSIIESFKNHTRDSVPVWMEKQGKPFLVTYYAVRDKKVNLEKIRRDNFQFTLRQEGEVDSIWIQPLLFIPFVENAVKHSFDSEHSSYVHVFFKVDAHRLDFRCENSKPAVAVRQGKVGGIGLANIQRRLGLLYPEHYKLEQREDENLYSVILSITL